MALQHDQKVNKDMLFPKSYKIIFSFLSRPILIICSNFIRILNLFYWANSCSLCSPCLSKYYFKLPLNSYCASVTLLHSQKVFHHVTLVWDHAGSPNTSQHTDFIEISLPWVFLAMLKSHTVIFLPSFPQHWWPTSKTAGLLSLDEKTCCLNILLIPARN